MKILLMHLKFPGQYQHIVQALCQNSENQIVFLSQHIGMDISFPNLRIIPYLVYIDSQTSNLPELKSMDENCLEAREVKAQLLKLRDQENFTPEVILAHPAWGNSLFIKHIYPNTPLISYMELCFSGDLSSGSFYNPLREIKHIELQAKQVKNLNYLLAATNSQHLISPTYWQANNIAKDFHSKLSVLHEGVDTDYIKPNKQLKINEILDLNLPDDAEIITHVERNFEPMRGFITMMKAIPEILNKRKNAHILMLGNYEEKGYEPLPPNVKNWRDLIEQHISYDKNRVHWLGKIPWSDYIKILQISDLHIYLSMPIQLSWSLIEAMAAGCNIISSATPPIMEVIKDGYNGLLIDFHSHLDLSNKVCEVLTAKESFSFLGENARKTVLEKYSLKHLLPLHLKLIETIAKNQSVENIKSEIHKLNPPPKEMPSLGKYLELS